MRVGVAWDRGRHDGFETGESGGAREVLQLLTGNDRPNQPGILLRELRCGRETWGPRP